MKKGSWIFLVFALLCSGWPGVSNAAEPPAKGALDMAILVDRSGSMKGVQNNMALALIQFIIDQTFFFQDDVRLVLIPFSDKAQSQPQQGFFTDVEPALVAAGKLPDPSGGTDIEAALETGQQRLAPFDGQRNKIAVMMTDGKPEPSPSDARRFPKTAEKISNKCGKPGTPNYSGCVQPFLDQISKESMDTIVNVLIPAFAGKMPLYTIALAGGSINREFLEACSRISTQRNDAFQIVERQNLITAANVLIPKGQNVINIYQRQVDERRSAPVEDTFRLPLSLKRVRFVVNYLDPGIREGEIAIEIHLPNGQILRNSGAESSLFSARAADGSLVFQRLILSTPVPFGDGKVVVKRTAGGALPRMLIVAEGIMTEGAFRITLTPPQPEAGDNLIIDARIEESGRVIPAEAIRGKIYAPDGRSVDISLDKKPDGTFQKTYPIPDGARGRHILTLMAVLNSKLNQNISGQTEFTVSPPNPVVLLPEIPFGGGEGVSQAPDALIFSPLGCSRLDYTISKIRILNEAKKSAPVSITISPLTSNEGQVLDPRKWIAITPSPAGVTAAGAPFTFNLKALVPKNIPGDLENATYRGTLNIECPDAGLQTIPVALPIHIPSFTDLPKRIEMTAYWRVPTTLTRSLSVKADGDCAINGKLICNQNFQDKKENFIEAASLSLNSPKPDFSLDKGSSASVSMEATLGNLPVGRYASQVYLDGDITRDAVLPVEVIVPAPSWNPWPYKGPGYRGNVLQVLHLLGILLLLLGFIRQLAARPFLRFRRGTSWFGSPNMPISITDPRSNSNLFRITQSSNGGGWSLQPTGSAIVSLNEEQIMGSADVFQNDQIRCVGFSFNVRQMTTGGIALGTLDSPFPEVIFRRPGQWMTLGAGLVGFGQILTWIF